MTSVEPSPLTRLKNFPTPDSHPARSPQTFTDTPRSRSPSKLPVRTGADASALYRSPTRASLAKHNPKLLRRSPYAYDVGKKANGGSSQETEGRGRLNFGAGAMLGAGSGGGSRGGARRVGGLRFPSSPATRRRSSVSSAVGNANNGAVPRSEGGSPVGRELGGGAGEETPEGPEPPIKQRLGGERVGGGKMQRRGAPPRTLKRDRPWSPEEEFEEKHRLQAARVAEVMQARVRELQAEIEYLKAEVKTQETRVGKETTELAKSSQSVVEALIKRLLITNDSSLTFPKASPPTALEEAIPSARPLQVADPLPQLKVFNALTFASTSTAALPGTPLTHEYTAAGFTYDRLLYFTITLTVASSAVQSITCRTSPWSSRELTPLLTTASSSGDISTIMHALSAYSLLSETRASTFSRLASAFPTLLPSLSLRRKSPGRPSRCEVIPYLGESLLHFRPRPQHDDGGGGVELVVEWKIVFDVTGEPESVLSADVRLASRWKEVDELNSFSKISGIFDSLVGEKGVFEATACIVRLLFD